MDDMDKDQAETAVEDTEPETQPAQAATPEPEAGNDIQESEEPSEGTRTAEADGTEAKAEAKTEQSASETETIAPKKPRKGRGRTAAAEDDEWLAWLDDLKAQGEQPNPNMAMQAGLAASGSTAKRYLARFRKTYPERF